MAALDFPTSPSTNDIYTANGRSWKWNGVVWVPQSQTFTNDGSFVHYDGSLNVGIGTTTPSTKFEVVGTITASAVTGPLTGNVIGNVTGTVSDISNHSTTDLSEGSNLYYTQGRFDTALTAKSTSNLSEGSNLYYTQGRFDTALTAKSTTDLSEGSNLYFTDERVDDRVNAMFVAGSNVTLTYDDNLNTFTVSASASGGSIITQDEGSQVNATSSTLNFVGAGVVVTDAGSGVSTITIAQGAISNLDDIGNVTVTTNTTGEILKWNGSAWINNTLSEAGISATGHTHVAADITDFDTEVANNSAVTANTAKVTNATHTGDVTGATTLTIATNVVTNAKLSTVSTQTIKGRTSASTGAPEDLTTTQVRTMLGIEAGATADQTAGEIEAIVNHDNLIGFVAAEHIDWSLTNAANIHPDNYTDTDTVYTHPSDGVDLGAALTGANVISDVTVNTAGHVTGFATRAMTASDIGAIPAGDIALGSDTSGNYVASITGTTNEIEVSGSGSETAGVTIGLPDNVTITGNLTVNGTTTTVNSTTVTIDDPVFTIGGDTPPASDDSKDRGIEFRYFDTAARIGFFGYDDSTNRFIATGTATNTNEVFSGTTLDAEFGTVFADLSGNATTATTWASGRTITLTGDVTGVSGSFDGSGNLSFATTVANNSHTHVAANITDFDTEVANNSAVTANTAKITNVTTDLGYNTAASTGTVTSSDGTNATLPAATTSLAGLLTGADKTKLDGIETNATANQTAGEIEAIVNHDNLIGFLESEHIDWADTSSENIHPNNYTNTTYVSSDFDHDSLTGFVANEHIDWTANQGATNINAGNYTDTVYTHPSDGVDLGAALTGANVISDVTVNTAGHVTGFATRAMTASDVGAIPAGDIVLGTETSGSYVQQGATSGNGLSGSVNAESATFTITSNATAANTASTSVFRNASGNFSAGTITAALTGNATTATTWVSGRTITLTGDVTGTSASFDGSGDLSFTTTIAANSVALGSDTTGNYVATVTGTTNEITVSGSGSETAGVTIGLPNAVTISGAMTAGSFIGDGSGLTNVNAVATSPPGSAVLGDLWYNSESGGLFIYYTDATPDSYWVQVGGADGAGTAGSSGSSPFVDTGTYVYYGGARDVGIGTATPTEALHVIGNILASEDVTAYSDESLKTDISTISGAINIVTQLRGVNYTKKSTQRASIGVIAQEVQKILPSVVHADPETGLLSVAYGNMVGVLIEAIKEQQDEIVELKQQMNDMMKRLDKLDGGN
jgi:hypothetical protein